MDFDRNSHASVVEALRRLIQEEGAFTDEYGNIRIQSYGKRPGKVRYLPLDEAATFAMKSDFKIAILCLKPDGPVEGAP